MITILPIVIIKLLLPLRPTKLLQHLIQKKSGTTALHVKEVEDVNIVVAQVKMNIPKMADTEFVKGQENVPVAMVAVAGKYSMIRERRKPI